MERGQRVVINNPDSEYHAQGGEVIYVSRDGKWAMVLVDGTYSDRRFKTKYLAPAADPVPVPDPPTPPVPPTPPTPTPTGNLIFNGSSAAAWPTKIGNRTDSINDVDDPLGGGFKVIRLKVYEGDRNVTSNPRAQLETAHQFGEGSEFYYSFRLLLPAGFPTRSPSWWAINEVYGKPYGGSPPWGLGGSNNDTLFGWTGVWTTPLAALIGKWTKLTVHQVHSSDPSKGRVRVWADDTFKADVKMATRNSTNNQEPNGVYAQFYRNEGTPWPSPTTVYFHKFKVGTTKEIVEA
jgi:hypothetical protein